MEGIAPDGLARKLDETVAELRDAINELRELARGIHPTILSEAGLEPPSRRSPAGLPYRSICGWTSTAYRCRPR